jgi:hypothetical protein
MEPPLPPAGLGRGVGRRPAAPGLDSLQVYLIAQLTATVERGQRETEARLDRLERQLQTATTLNQASQSQRDVHPGSARSLNLPKLEEEDSTAYTGPSSSRSFYKLPSLTQNGGSVDSHYAAHVTYTPDRGNTSSALTKSTPALRLLSELDEHPERSWGSSRMGTKAVPGRAPAQRTTRHLTLLPGQPQTASVALSSARADCIASTSGDTGGTTAPPPVANLSGAGRTTWMSEGENTFLESLNVCHFPSRLK